jgi:predicted phosphoribosyltransferase
MFGRASPFSDRRDAGRELAERLSHYAGREEVVVFGLPRGGVPVAYEVAAALGAPLDVLVVRKLGVPGHDELAMGAIASGGVRVLNTHLIGDLGLDTSQVDAVSSREQRELERQEREFRGDRPSALVRGATAILVDDGLATGATMRAAVAAVRERGAGTVVVAVPVASREVCASFENEVDEVVCARTPEPLRAVGLWYRDFSPTSDEDVRELLAEGLDRRGVR